MWRFGRGKLALCWRMCIFLLLYQKVRWCTAENSVEWPCCLAEVFLFCLGYQRSSHPSKRTVIVVLLGYLQSSEVYLKSVISINKEISPLKQDETGILHFWIKLKYGLKEHSCSYLIFISKSWKKGRKAWHSKCGTLPNLNIFVGGDGFCLFFKYCMCCDSLWCCWPQSWILLP